MIDQIGSARRERRMNQPRLGRLQLAAVAPAAFRIEEQVVLLQDLGDVRLQRDQVRGILRVAADRDRAGDVPMEQAERAAEQIDPSGDERRPHAVVVEHERFDEIVGVALVVRRVDDAMAARRVQDVMQVLGLALDLPENGIERVLQRAVNRIPLRRPQLVEIGVDALARLIAVFPVVAAEVPEHLLALEDGLRNVIQHADRSDYSTGFRLQALGFRPSARPRSR